MKADWLENGAANPSLAQGNDSESDAVSVPGHWSQSNFSALVSVVLLDFELVEDNMRGL